jgi:hypothetical protein
MLGTMPKPKKGTKVPTPKEDAQIAAGIAADPDTHELSDEEFSRLRPTVPGIPGTEGTAAVAGLLNEIETPSGELPAVIVNPDASPAALLGWVAGQLRVLHTMAVGCENQDPEHLAELPEAVATLTEQMEAVLDALAGKLRRHDSKPARRR